MTNENKTLFMGVYCFVIDLPNLRKKCAKSGGLNKLSKKKITKINKKIKKKKEKRKEISCVG